MNGVDKPVTQAQETRRAMEEATIRTHAVWLRYLTFTGAANEYEIDAYLCGLHELPAWERDLLSRAVNELILELPPRKTAPYSKPATSSQHNTTARDDN